MSTKSMENCFGKSFSTRITLSSKADSEFFRFNDTEGDKNRKIIFPVDFRESFSSRQRLSADLERLFKNSKTDWTKLARTGSIDLN